MLSTESDASTLRPEDRWTKPVAYLAFHHTLEPQKNEQMPVHPNDEFDIGRTTIPASWNMNRMTISTHHLRLHCVDYDDYDDTELPIVSPMTYVRVVSSYPVQLSRPDFNSPGTGDYISKTDGDILLNHGDVLCLTPTVRITYLGTRDTPAHDEIQLAEMRCFADKYHISDRVLGRGVSGSVFIAVKRSTRRQVACKILSLPDPTSAQSKGDRRTREKMVREYEVLKGLNHPNIVSLERVFSSTRHVYIFQELITGGDLMSYLGKRSYLISPQAAVLIRQILKAVDYLHDHQIVHRDIKPENIMMTSWRDGARVVLTDFGQARMLHVKKSSADRMQSLVGTRGYVAPEAFAFHPNHHHQNQASAGYTKAVDLWSVGCTTAIVLTGETLFRDRDHTPVQNFEDTQEEHNIYPSRLEVMDTGFAWDSVGDSPKSFIRGCLVKDERRRFTAKQALQHEWFSNAEYADKMEAAYQRAIQDWRPRPANSNIIEYLNPTLPASATSHSESVKRLAVEASSRHILPSNIQSTGFPQPPAQFLPPRVRGHTPLPTIDENSSSPPGQPGSFDDSTPYDKTTTFASVPDFVPNTPPQGRCNDMSMPCNFEAEQSSMADDPPQEVMQLTIAPPQSFNSGAFRVFTELQYSVPASPAGETRKRPAIQPTRGQKVVKR